MIGRTEWFTYRVAGWGVTPRTWQGWVYVLGAIGLFVGLGSLPLPEHTKNIMLGTLGGVFFLDLIIIWSQLGKVHDERDRQHQIIIERNCSLAAVLGLVGAMFYQTYQHAASTGQGLPFDPLLLVVAGIMVLTKLISTLYYRRKG